jgi:hypothetical protein
MFKNRDTKVFASIAAVMIVLIAVSYIIKNFPQNYDNTNEDSLSIFSHQGKWTYFSHLSAGSNIDKINGAVYKFTEDEPVPVKFSEEAAGGINVKGDWIYYVDTMDMRNNTASISKMKTDGSEKTKLVDEASFGFRLYGNYIYYKKDSSPYALLRVKLDGSSNKTISSDVLSFYIQGSWIYYISSTHPGALYKMKLDGSSSKKIADISGPIMYINDNYIYFIETDNESTKSNNKPQIQNYYVGNAGRLFRIRKDGSEKELVFDDKIVNIFVRNHYIYYTPFSNTMDINENSKLYRTDLNGKHKIEFPLKGFFIGIVDKWIYYTDNKNGEVYRTTLDLKKEQKIETDIFKPN